MKKTSFCALAGLSLLLLYGCATPTKMAFESDSERVSEAGNPVYLMTATIKNTYKSGYQPRLLVVNVEKAGAKSKADRINFKVDEKAKGETEKLPEGNSYLLRMELAPGAYEIRGLSSNVMKFPVIATFFAPLHSPLNAQGPGVYYLGHVEATVRERKDNEFKAGPSIPLIDQAVAGASGGTFDIEISDRFASDENAFRTRFAALKSVEIRKAILPPFDRAKAQQWWESH